MSDREPCTECRLTGFTDHVKRGMFTMEPADKICPKCGGRGWRRNQTIGPAMLYDDDIHGGLAIQRDARSAGFRSGFVIACIELSATHGHDDLAYLLLHEAGIDREAALSATEADDHDKVRAIFDNNDPK